MCLTILAEGWKLPDEFREVAMQAVFHDLLDGNFCAHLMAYLEGISNIADDFDSIQSTQSTIPIDILELALPVLKMGALFFIRSPIRQIVPELGRDKTISVRVCSHPALIYYTTLRFRSFRRHTC